MGQSWRSVRTYITYKIFENGDIMDSNKPSEEEFWDEHL